jgi:D-glycero-D-manno-heptose 1,7-bisphosphate phosphatase
MLQQELSAARACVFIDRDGTLNVEKKYLHKYADWEWIPGSVKMLKTLHEAGFLNIVITNQAGVARGYYDTAAIKTLHAQVDEELLGTGAVIDAYYFCPHHPQYGEERNCSCRKPAPGMLLTAKEQWNISMARSWMIGDKISDIEAGLAAGVRCILVATGYGEEERQACPAGVWQAADFAAAGALILQDMQRN